MITARRAEQSSLRTSHRASRGRRPRRQSKRSTCGTRAHFATHESVEADVPGAARPRRHGYRRAPRRRTSVPIGRSIELLDLDFDACAVAHEDVAPPVADDSSSRSRDLSPTEWTSPVFNSRRARERARRSRGVRVSSAVRRADPPRSRPRGQRSASRGRDDIAVASAIPELDELPVDEELVFRRRIDERRRSAGRTRVARRRAVGFRHARGRRRGCA